MLGNIAMIAPDYEPSYGGIGVHVKDLLKYASVDSCVYLFIGRLKRIENHYGHIENNTSNVKIIEYQYQVNNELRINFQNEYAGKKEFEDVEKAEYNVEFFKFIVNYIRTHDIRIDLIHMHDVYSGISGVSLKKALGIPLLLTLHSLNARNDNLTDSLRRYAIYNSDHVIFVSSALKEEAIKRYNLNDEISNMTVIHNGIDTFAEADNPLTANAAIRKNDVLQITFCGRLEYAKGCDILIQAFHLLWKKNNRIQLNIVGNGTEYHNLKDMANRLGIMDYITFHGHLSKKEVDRIYDLSDIVVVPSRFEAFGIVVLEAMLHKVCVVCSDLDVFGEIIFHNKSGKIVDNIDANNLCRVLEELIGDLAQREMLVENAYETVIERFGWDKIALQTKAVYQKLIVKVTDSGYIE